ncbi:TM2 domain-containing protein [Campylobacter concisus]|uniref:TM2 domain-containing protein n=1 Tax=Campylobacter concisus TaxID=199 RepID=UPI000CD804E5|nr:TM2 domain-containing protein [Campylobacter concisus]
MNTSSVIAMLQDKLPKDFTLLKMLENKLGTLDEKRLDELAQKIPILNLKSPIFVFWVGSFIFGALGVNRFMIGQTALGLAKLALFILYIVFIFLFSKVIISVDEWITPEEMLYLMDLAKTYSKIINIFEIIIIIWWVIDLFITDKSVRKQNLEKISKAIDE